MLLPCCQWYCSGFSVVYTESFLHSVLDVLMLTLFDFAENTFLYKSNLSEHNRHFCKKLKTCKEKFLADYSPLHSL